MKNITVSIDEETHRLARIRAMELDTSVSMLLVQQFLRSLVSSGETTFAEGKEAETETETALTRFGRCWRTLMPSRWAYRKG